MHKYPVIRQLFRVLMLLVLITLGTSCGADSGDQTPTEQAITVAATSTTVPTPTAEPEDEGGGVIRTIRGAPGAVLDGVSWVRDRGSDGVGFVWGGIQSGTGFLWDRVTGLPASTWDVIKSFWRWFVSTDIGDKGRTIVTETIELAKQVNPGAAFDRLMGFLQNLVIGLLEIVGLIALIILVVFGVVRWGLWMHVVRLFWGSAENGLSKIPTPVASPNRQSTPKANNPEPSNRQERKTNPDSPSAPTTQTVSSGTEAGAGEEWSRSQIHELRELVSNQTIIVLFGRASRSGGDPVCDVELMRATGRSRAQIRTDFSAFARTCQVIHSEASLPIETVESTADGSQEAYRVPDQYLEWWFED